MSGTRPALTALPGTIENCRQLDYQLAGVNFLRSRRARGISGALLADEMGLGKTLQSIAFLASIRTDAAQGLEPAWASYRPSLVICPLGVLRNWHRELQRFWPASRVMLYMGNRAARAALQDEVKTSVRALPKAQRGDPPTLPFDVLLTTYEAAMHDEAFLSRLRWEVMVMDEGHRLKNAASKVSAVLRGYSVGFKVMLSGTPMQNEVGELLTLMEFLVPDEFGDRVALRDRFKDMQVGGLVQELQDKLRPFMLRRTKEEVLQVRMPQKHEVVLYAGMTEMQKKYYRHVLSGNAEALGKQNARSLVNVLASLRKACSHPYLFRGAEPEPFEEGDHLWQNAGKFFVLDKLLPVLRERGRRVLIFSTSVGTLDILQDYLAYRGHSYERIDGSVRGQERFMAIDRFTESDTFVFLLSSRAGGLGLNLVSANTVIFMDMDWNPQVDLQAEARVHRIGQTDDVLVIKLITRHTCEEVIAARAAHKKALSDRVIEEGDFGGGSSESPGELMDAIAFGLDELNESGVDHVTEEDMATLVDSVLQGDGAAAAAAAAPGVGSSSSAEASSLDASSSIYVYQGTDFGRRDKCQAALSDLIADASGAVAASSSASSSSSSSRSKRKRQTAQEVERRRKQKREAAAERAQIRAAQREQARLAKWSAAGYQSLSLPLPDDDGNDDVDLAVGEEVEDDEALRLRFVQGDASKPEQHAAPDEQCIIVNWVDDSGGWPNRGFFVALSALSDLPQRAYEQAAEMDDLAVGDAHLVRVSDRVLVCHAVVLHRAARSNRVGTVKPSAVLSVVQRLGHYARLQRPTRVSIHVPRYSPQLGKWYATERSLLKYLATRGVPTSVYYYSRRRSQQAQAAVEAASASGPFQGVTVLLLPELGLEEARCRSLARHLLAQGGQPLRNTVDASNQQGSVVAVAKQGSAHAGAIEAVRAQLPAGSVVVSAKWLLRSLKQRTVLAKNMFIL